MSLAALCKMELPTSELQAASPLTMAPPSASTPTSTSTTRKRSNSNVAGVLNRKCAYCDRRFSKAEHLKRHQRSHTGEKPFRCNVCLKSYARSDVLIRHTRNHHSDVTQSEVHDAGARRKGEVKSSGSRSSSRSVDQGDVGGGANGSLPTGYPEGDMAGSLDTHQNLLNTLDPSLQTATGVVGLTQMPLYGQQHLAPNTLHRMSSQHDGSCLIEAALQAAEPPTQPSFTLPSFRNLDQPVVQQIMPQQAQMMQPTRTPLSQDAQMYPMYTQSLTHDLSHWLETCDVDMQPLPYGLDLWGDSAMMDFMDMSDAFLSVPAPRSVPRQRPSFTKDVPDERFHRVERLWPLRRNTTQSSSGQTMWEQVVAHTEDSLFSDPGLREQYVSSQPVRRTGSSRWGLGEECRTRLIRDYGGGRPRGGSQGSRDTVETATSKRSDTASDVASGSRFPPAEVLDMSLDLYFRRFHAFMPFIHRATFDARATPAALLLPMCLIGLEALDCEGSRKFIRAYLPVCLCENWNRSKS
jgi:hypothetical protein